MSGDGAGGREGEVGDIRGRLEPRCLPVMKTSKRLAIIAAAFAIAVGAQAQTPTEPVRPGSPGDKPVPEKPDVPGNPPGKRPVPPPAPEPGTPSNPVKPGSPPQKPPQPVPEPKAIALSSLRN